MKPSPSTLPSSNLFVATVVPWLTAVIASPPASTRCFVGWTPARKPSAGSDGVDGVLVVTTSPVPTSTATTSVKVPPVSIPILTRRLTWPIPPPGPVPGVGESCQVPFARAGWCGAMRREPRGAGGAPAHAPRVHRPGGADVDRDDVREGATGVDPDPHAATHVAHSTAWPGAGRRRVLPSPVREGWLVWCDEA